MVSIAQETIPTERIGASKPTYLPDRPGPIIAALLVIAAGAFRLGWLTRELLPLAPYRGWAALVLFAVVFAAWAVAESNRRAT